MVYRNLEGDKEEMDFAIFLLTSPSAAKIQEEMFAWLEGIPPSEREAALITRLAQLSRFVGLVMDRSQALGVNPFQDLADRPPRHLTVVPRLEQRDGPEVP